MKNNGKYRIWSITTQQYVVLKVKEDKFEVNSKGAESDNWSELFVVLLIDLYWFFAFFFSLMLSFIKIQPTK